VLGGGGLPAGALALDPLGGLAWVAEGRHLAGRRVGVVLESVEAQDVPVRVTYLGQNPAHAGPVHPGMGLSHRIECAGEPVHGRLVRHADSEVVESGRRTGPVGVESQSQARTARGMGQGVTHQDAVLHELDLDLVPEAAAVPLQ
jgi:hypothetical protein